MLLSDIPFKVIVAVPLDIAVVVPVNDSFSSFKS